MDSLPAERSIVKSIARTFAVYEPLLRASRKEILSTLKSTHRYGSHPRHVLDLYSPATVTSQTPILIWVYGGGLTHGDRVRGGSRGLYADGTVFTNIGHFFTKHFGFIVAIPDYRLVKHGATYPSGGEDVGLAINWLAQHYKTDRDLFLIGNSSGGIHLATWLFAPELASIRQSMSPLKLKAAVLFSMPFDQERAGPERFAAIKSYFGSHEQIKARIPIALLRSADATARSIRLLVFNTDKEPDDKLSEELQRFQEKCTEYKISIESMISKGHNHVSPPLSLGTGIAREEEWGFVVGDWLLGRESSERPRRSNL